MPTRTDYATTSEAETLALARSFASTLRRGDVVALMGELGTGKTRFVKGICQWFGADEVVSSPSFVILNRYEGKDTHQRPLYLYHLDLYRVRSADEIYDLGFEEFAYGENITMIEWSEQLNELMPSRHYEVRLCYGAEPDLRAISIAHIEETVRPPTNGRVARKL